jgi:hypothetical protein
MTLLVQRKKQRNGTGALTRVAVEPTGGGPLAYVSSVLREQGEGKGG